MERLVEEVRGMFKSEDEINIQSVNKLTYMLACLNEAMRFYPPVPTGMPRTVSKNGCQILGNFVPENVSVRDLLCEASQLTIARPSWLHTIGPLTIEKIISPTPLATTPSASWAMLDLPMTGLRYCSHSMLGLGTAWDESTYLSFSSVHLAISNENSLAYTEMRLILARVIYNFDMKLADDSKDWIGQQKIYMMWEKKPLNVYLTPRTTTT